MSKSVLLITHSEDPAAEVVEAALRARGATACRFDTDRFPREIELVLSQGLEPKRFAFSDRGRTVELSSLDAVWYRRFYSAKLSEDLDPRYVAYSRSEARTLLTALFATLTEARWIDPIDRVHRAHHKMLQLEIAKRAGFAIPETLSTNDPEAVRAFLKKHEHVVTKMLNSISFQADGNEQMVFTTRVTEEHLEDLAGLRHCPAVFQEMIPKDVELRVAVVGRRLFVASIDSRKSEDGSVDWRRDQDLAHKFRADSVPEPVEAAILRVMDALELTYGSFDIIRRPDGEHVFLEVNSAGEWMWLKEMVGLPIDEAIADELLR